MTVYCVSYDLKKAGQNYSALYDELKASPGWWHYLDSTWLVRLGRSKGRFAAVNRVKAVGRGRLA